MADLVVIVDTAVVVPVNLLPLLDDTDFKTIETAVVYNSAGMALVWNFVTPAGVTTATAVTPTTGGVYDWSEPVADKGMYAIEIPASGGASINNDTEGVGWFTGVATGVLPWRGPTIQFSPANVVNSLVTGSDKLDVNVEEWNATSVPAEHTAGYPITTIKDGAGTGEINTNAGKVVGVELVDVLTTYTGNTPQTGDSFARIGANGSGLTSLASQASVDELPTNAELATALGAADDAVLSQLAIIATYIDTEIGSIKERTDLIPADPADASAVAALISALSDIATAIKAKTDSLTFTAAGKVDANIKMVNDVAVTGDGDETPWGPA